jgi:hypothetical protein
MDEAFTPFASILRRLTEISGDFVATEEGVRTYVTALDIATPVELDISRDATGALRIGTTPPLYAMRTSVSPSFHRLRFVARPEELE